MQLTLKFPFTTAAGQKIEQLTLRRPKVKDLKAANRFGSDEATQEIALLGILSSLTPEDLEEMDLADYTVLQGYFRQMLGASGHPVASNGAAGEVVQLPAQ